MTTEELNTLIAKAEAGDVAAMNQLGLIYGQDEYKDLSKAFYWISKSAETGDILGMANLGGWCYLWGNGTEKNIPLAIEWLEKAAEKGSVWSMNRLTHIFGNVEGYTNYEQAAKWFLELIKRDCNPSSGWSDENSGYNKDLYEKIKNTILNSTTEEEMLSSLSGVGNGGSLFSGAMSFTTSNAKSYINQAEAIINVIELIEKDYGIDNGPFKHISGNFVIPNRVKRIGNHVFDGCKNLSSISIPNSVISIGKGAFWDCSGLTSVTIPNSVTSIGESAFSGCSNLTSVTIPNSITHIKEFTFHACFRLSSVTIPNSVTNIGERAFSRCSNLTSVTIPNSVTSIGNGAFFDCKGLTSVIIPNCITSIGYATFEYCEGLTSVIVPNSVTSIGIDAFSGCSCLKSLTIHNGVKNIERGAFSFCRDLAKIIVPKGSKSRFMKMDGLKDYKSKIVEK